MRARGTILGGTADPGASPFLEKCMSYEVKPKGVTIATGGNGLWSSRVADVRITSIKVDDDDEDDPGSYCTVNVYFDRRTWNDSTNPRRGGLINRSVGGDGLIYTDETWLANLKAWLVAQGMTRAEVKDLDYTEQGMQEEGMVSMESGGKFLKGFARTFSK